MKETNEKHYHLYARKGRLLRRGSPRLLANYIESIDGYKNNIHTSGLTILIFWILKTKVI